MNESWSAYDVGIGIKPALGFGPNGLIHIMGMTEASQGEVWHASSEIAAGPWLPRTVLTGYFYGPGDLVVDTDGTAHMAWHNHTDQDPNHATVEADGTITIYRIETPGNHNGWDDSLAFDELGTLHIASVDPATFGATQSLEYGSFDGALWTFGNVPSSPSFMYGLATSIAIDQDNDPHIAFCEATAFLGPGTLYYAVRDTGAWSFTPVVSGENRGRFPSLLLDSTDTPHLAWLDVDTTNTSIGYVQYAAWNGSSWDIEQVDTLSNVELAHTEARKSVSIQMDSGGTVHIAYADKRAVRYGFKTPGGWNVTTVLSSTDDLYKGMVELALSPNERPTIVFWQRDPSEPGLVRLAVQQITTGVDKWRCFR